MNFDEFAPVTKAEAVALTDPLPAAGLAPAPVVSAEAPPRFVGGRPRTLVVDLECPLEFRGRVYEAITLRRLTAAEVGRYFERLAEIAAADPSAKVIFPIFVDENGQRIPDEVIEMLDAEDDERVMVMASDFLPARLLRLRASL